MPLLDTSDYRPARCARINGHTATIYPYLIPCRAPVPWSSRQRLDTPDGDFVDIDLALRGSDSLVIFLHGLEGRSSSSYIRTLATRFPRFDLCGFNNRSCGGELNRTPRAYHAAATEDLAQTIETFAPRYRSIYLAGFSLGACQLLNYLGSGKHALPPNLKAAAAVSPPCDLLASGHAFEKRRCGPYAYRFLRTLKAKVLEKIRRFPDEGRLPDAATIKRVRTLFEFDACYTAPLHGFASAKDYYIQASPLRHLEKIPCPTLILSAADDPFLSPECLPLEAGRRSPHLHVAITPRGGHVRFPQAGGGSYADGAVSGFFSQTA